MDFSEKWITFPSYFRDYECFVYLKLYCLWTIDTTFLLVSFFSISLGLHQLCSRCAHKAEHYPCLNFVKTCTYVLFTQKVTLALLMHCFTGILGTFKPEVFTQHLSFDCFLLWAFKESSKEVAKILFFIFFLKFVWSGKKEFTHKNM